MATRHKNRPIHNNVGYTFASVRAAQTRANRKSAKLPTSLDELSEKLKTGIDIPRNKLYPSDAVQCTCGGFGCEVCDQKGWLPKGHAAGRRCLREGCNNPIPPSHVAVYCCNECARQDA